MRVTRTSLATLLVSFLLLNAADAERGLSVYPSAGITFPGGPCLNLPADDYPHDGANSDGWSLAMNHNDDSSSSLISLPFNFQFYGTDYNNLYINNNGNLSFGSRYYTYTPYGFPVSGYPMVAPFWGDVDTRVSYTGDTGHVWMKMVGSNKLAVTWDVVGYYPARGELENSFQVLISDGTDESMGLGNNVCFCYADMQWTTGGASGGSGGFGGTPATVGANKGDGVKFFQIGRFDHAGDDYDGPQGNADGVSYLDHTFTCFDSGSNNIPPITVGFPGGNSINLEDCEPLDLTVSFLSPEASQTTSVVVSGEPLGMVVTNNGGNTATVRLEWSPDSDGTNVVNFVATDSEGGVTEADLTIVASNCNSPPVAICENVVVSANENCIADLIPSQVAGGSTDPDGDALTLTFTAASSPFPLGTTPVTVTVSDGQLSDTCTATVTVNDDTPPTAVCQDVTVSLDASGAGSTTAAVVNNGSSDNCGIASHSLDVTDFTCAEVGSHMVQLTVTDVNGNVSPSCQATVTVVDDTPPTALCQDVTVWLDASGAGSTTADAVNHGSSDNCGIASHSLDVTDFDCADVGSHTVQLTVTDVNDQLTDTCTATVTVVDDEALDEIKFDCGGPDIIAPNSVPVDYRPTYTKANSCGVDVTIKDASCSFCNGSGKTVDKLAGDGCEVSYTNSPPVFTIEDSGGVEDHIAWVNEVCDSNGCEDYTCTICVTNPGNRKSMRTLRGLAKFVCPSEWDAKVDEYQCPDLV